MFLIGIRCVSSLDRGPRLNYLMAVSSCLMLFGFSPFIEVVIEGSILFSVG